MKTWRLNKKRARIVDSIFTVVGVILLAVALFATHDLLLFFAALFDIFAGFPMTRLIWGEN